MEYCEHLCSGNCRRNGCNCNCGEFHLATKEEQEKQFNEDREQDKRIAERELFNMVYHWGRNGIITDENCNAFQDKLKEIRLF